MNGAAMNCRQDPVLQPQHQDSSSHHNSGYHFQINRQQNLQQQNSKTLNYQSFSSNFQVDGFHDNLHQHESFIGTRHSTGEVRDPRFPKPRTVRSRSDPIDLPVPKFLIDEHSVSDALVQGSKGLDLDTRIDLLIKSKALAGMHPIFSDLNDSEESESDVDDLLLTRPRSKFRKESKSVHSIPSDIETPVHESFDDPEKPLSRPPSPFLSRATYLFWFNKAIEIKQQAKAQEQALLEQATKRLLQDTSSTQKTRQFDRPCQKRPIPKDLIDEISKEIKEVLKQEFIREVIEQTAFNTLDDWWDQQCQQKCDVLINDIQEQEMLSHTTGQNCEKKCTNKLEPQGSTSPKMPFPWEKSDKQNTFQVKGNFEQTCYDKMALGGKTLCENYQESFDILQPISKDTISSNSASKEDQESQPKEVDEKGNFEDNMNRQEDVNVVVCYSNKINDHKCKERPTLEEGVNVETRRLDSSKSETLYEKDEISQSITSNNNSSVGNKFDDKLEIVKDILDFILNNVNTIVLRKKGSKASYKELNNKLACQNTSNFTNLEDSFENEKINVDSPQDFVNGGL